MEPLSPPAICREILKLHNGGSLYLITHQKIVEHAPSLARAYLEQERRIEKLEAVVEAARIMRFYCLGSDASTENMLIRFDTANVALAEAQTGEQDG